MHWLLKREGAIKRHFDMQKLLNKGGPGQQAEAQISGDGVDVAGPAHAVHHEREKGTCLRTGTGPTLQHAIVLCMIPFFGVHAFAGAVC